MIHCPFAQPPSLLRITLSLLLGWLMGCASPPVPSGAETAPTSPHLRLVSQEVEIPVFDFTEEVDFDGLRHWFGRREDFARRCEGAVARRAAGGALLRQDHAEAERLTAPLVAGCPVDPSLHLWRYASLLALGRASEAELHRDWYVGLMESILRTGDGASARTPFVTISSAEVFAVLSHLGLTAERRWHVAGPPELDVFDTRSEAGVRTSVYFHPAFRALRGGPRLVE